MEIRRRGASANHGTKAVALKISKMQWMPASEVFDITFSGAATDFSTGGRHHYRLRFSAKELATLVQNLADAAPAMDGDEFAETFQKASPSLFKLQAMASGMRV